jgi:hypothetical protein
MGAGTSAIGENSTAMGSTTYAYGDNSTSMGYLTSARGFASAAMNQSNLAHGFASTVVGMYNDTIVAPETISNSDTPLFIVGNGNSHNDRSNAMVVFKDGRVGIGTNNPGAFKLEVNGDAAKPGGGNWTASSDIRLKKDIRNYQEGLAAVNRIRPVYYRYNEQSGYATDKEYVGVIAQELRLVAPDMVSTFEKDGEAYLQVDNSAMVYMLINAVHELSERNQVLEERVSQSEKLLNSMHAELNDVAQYLAALKTQATPSTDITRR